MTSLSDKLAWVYDLLEKNPNISFFLVGGTVRDLLLKKEVNDFDLVVLGLRQEGLISLLDSIGTVVSIEGRTFGVIKFKPKHFPLMPFKEEEPISFDIALPRRERYAAGQRRKNAEVELTSDIKEDLARRDFTVNAMALQLGVGRLVSGVETPDIIDPFNGLSDLENKIIRAVGDPTERFTEDPTRILRGIRLAAQLNFVIEPKTLEAMRRLSPEITKKFVDDRGRTLERVSSEMIGLEFSKSFDSNPVTTLDLYDQTGLLKLLLPEVESMKNIPQPPEFHSEGDVFVHTRMVLAALPKGVALITKLAALLHDIGKPPTFSPASKTGDRIRFNNHDKIGAEIARQILNRLKFPKQIVDDVAWLVENHMRLPFGFPHMKMDKQKNFARNPLFPQLITLVCADAEASIFPDGGPNPCNFLKPVKQVLAEIEKEKEAGRPVEFMNGHEIISIIQEQNSHFDPKKEGKKIGDLKKRINSLYDRGEVESKEEAKALIRKWLDQK